MIQASSRRLAAGLLFGLFAALAAPAARAGTEVDLALVLAVDVSRSMDPEEQELQRQGFVDAMRSPLVHDAVQAERLVGLL